MGRQRITSGTRWEEMAGYSRALRVGRQVYVSGTTATARDGSVVGVGSAYEQTVYIIRLIEQVLHSAGAALEDVVRTRIYIIDLQDWEAVARAHGEHFALIRPANTLIQVSGLVGPDYLVEMEADAVIGDEG
jgi:enamine deaminase RidA (YjgF/YER057c/UK114 family)